MSADLYEDDALAWSEQQAALLRRVARGELVTGVDWAHVVEEIEDVGLSELNAVHALLHQMLFHLLKIHGWPTLTSCRHWRSAIIGFQTQAERRYAPSMRQRIDLGKVYARACQQIEPLQLGGSPATPPPATCPVTLDQLLNAPCAALEAAFQAKP